MCIFRKILVCLDGSEVGEKVLPYAAQTAEQLGSKVVLLRVVYLSAARYGQAAIGGPEGRVHQQQAAAQENEAKAYLERVAGPLRAKGLDVEAVTLRGTPSETIVRYADGNGVDLVAMATHRRTGLGRLVFGSVADFVLRELGVPVLVIKPEDMA